MKELITKLVAKAGGETKQKQGEKVVHYYSP